MTGQLVADRQTAISPLVVATGWRDPDRVRWPPTLSTSCADQTAAERPVMSV